MVDPKRNEAGSERGFEFQVEILSITRAGSGRMTGVERFERLAGAGPLKSRDAPD
jgi:hypothetical protein